MKMRENRQRHKLYNSSCENIGKKYWHIHKNCTTQKGSTSDVTQVECQRVLNRRKSKGAKRVARERITISLVVICRQIRHSRQCGKNHNRPEQDPTMARLSKIMVARGICCTSQVVSGEPWIGVKLMVNLPRIFLKSVHAIVVVRSFVFSGFFFLHLSPLPDAFFYLVAHLRLLPV